MGNLCSKDPHSPMAFGGKFLKAVLGVRVSAGGPSSDWW